MPPVTSTTRPCALVPAMSVSAVLSHLFWPEAQRSATSKTRGRSGWASLTSGASLHGTDSEEQHLWRGVAAQELEHAVLVDATLAQRLVQRVDRVEHRAVDAEQDVAFAQPGAGRRAAGLDREDAHAAALGEAVMRHDASIDRHRLAAD